MSNPGNKSEERSQKRSMWHNGWGINKYKFSVGFFLQRKEGIKMDKKTEVIRVNLIDVLGKKNVTLRYPILPKKWMTQPHISKINETIKQEPKIILVLNELLSTDSIYIGDNSIIKGTEAKKIKNNYMFGSFEINDSFYKNITFRCKCTKKLLLSYLSFFRETEIIKEVKNGHYLYGYLSETDIKDKYDLVPFLIEKKYRRENSLLFTSKIITKKNKDLSQTNPCLVSLLKEIRKKTDKTHFFIGNDSFKKRVAIKYKCAPSLIQTYLLFLSTKKIKLLHHKNNSQQYTINKINGSYLEKLMEAAPAIRSIQKETICSCSYNCGITTNLGAKYVAGHIGFSEKINEKRELTLYKETFFLKEDECSALKQEIKKKGISGKQISEGINIGKSCIEKILNRESKGGKLSKKQKQDLYDFIFSYSEEKKRETLSYAESEYLKTKMKEKGITQKKLAEDLNIKYNSMYYILYNKKNVTLELKKRIYKYISEEKPQTQNYHQNEYRGYTKYRGSIALSNEEIKKIGIQIRTKELTKKTVAEKIGIDCYYFYNLFYKTKGGNISKEQNEKLTKYLSQSFSRKKEVVYREDNGKTFLIFNENIFLKKLKFESKKIDDLDYINNKTRKEIKTNLAVKIMEKDMNIINDKIDIILQEFNS